MTIVVLTSEKYMLEESPLVREHHPCMEELVTELTGSVRKGWPKAGQLSDLLI